MRTSFKRTLVAGATSGLLLASLTGTAGAWGERDSYGGDSQRGQASSYINPDTGAATANPDVDPGSSCFAPDQYDRQAFSPAGTTTRNVHNDACFLGRDGQKLDGPASFESSGVGFISACPDPDNAGPKVAVLSDRNGDERNDLCFQSGYQQKGVAGDLEFHARLNNNTGMAGAQYVTWCSDSDRDGCGDEWNRSSIQIDWSADGTATYSSGDRYSSYR
ncbi:MAG: hypothetical protein ABIX10_15680 [Acidimicrobiales bacterium]